MVFGNTLICRMAERLGAGLFLGHWFIQAVAHSTECDAVKSDSWNTEATDDGEISRTVDRSAGVVSLPYRDIILIKICQVIAGRNMVLRPSELFGTQSLLPGGKSW